VRAVESGADEKRAGRSTLERLGGPGLVLICEAGEQRRRRGGDGPAFDLRGRRVRVLWRAVRQSADAAANLHVLRHCDVPIEHCGDAHDPQGLARLLDGAEWIVDALFGIGFQGTLRSPLDQVIAGLNRHAGRRLAVDLPSGLDADTGAAAPGTFRADHTVTFVAPKLGFRQPAASEFIGRVHVVDIGAPRRLVEEVLHGAPHRKKN
jgi:NAD(P)H-hydrate epimerase